MGEYVLQRIRDANGLVQRAGPYVLIELLLPGDAARAAAVPVPPQRHRRAAPRRTERPALAGARLESALHLASPARRLPRASAMGLSHSASPRLA